MKKIFLVFLIFTQFLVPTSLSAQKTEIQNSIKLKIDNYLSEGLKNGFSGAILVAEKGEIIINQGYGLADKKNNTQNTPNTIFDIGSNTKQFTAAAILKLSQLDKLKVTDSLTTFFPNLPSDKGNITIHQLLTHTAGFKGSIGRDFDLITREDFFKEVFASELLHKPASKYSYSNIGYSILARIIELISKKDYEVFLNEYLFKPSRMNQTGYLLPKWNANLLAIGYNRNIMDTGATVNRYQEDGGVSWHLKGNGGINSSQEDMYKWIKALSSNTILSTSLFKKYTTSYTGNINDSFGYAYGWGITNSDRDTKRITHNGSNGAFAHSIIWLPNEDVIILYSTNAGSPKVERLAYNIEKIIFNQNYQSEPIKKNPYFLVFDFIENHSSKDSKELYSIVKNDANSDFKKSGVLNSIGYMILEKDENLEWAIEIFRLNSQLFEDEGNVWDSLGDGYLANGQKKDAIISFRKAVALKNEGTLKKLNELLQKE